MLSHSEKTRSADLYCLSDVRAAFVIELTPWVGIKMTTTVSSLLCHPK